MTVSAPIKRPQQAATLPAAKKQKSFVERAKFIALCVLWQLLALLVVEGVLYWDGLGEEDIFNLDKQIGFMHFPNKRVTWRSEGYSQSYFNADGIRDEPDLTVAKPAGVYRIALLGDSMVEGLQVPSNQTFGKLLEKRLRGEGAKNVQVINFGNSGYSTAQEYMLLKIKVLKYKPDLVVVGYTNRDMFENWSPPDQTLTNVRPRAVQPPGQKLIVDNAPILKWMHSPRAKFLMQIQWLRQNSRIWGMISATETQLSFKDPVYRAIIGFATRPGKTFNLWMDNLKTIKWQLPSLAQLTSPSFSIRFFETDQEKANANLVNSSITHAPAAVPGLKYVTAPQLNSDSKSGANAGKADGGNEKGHPPAAQNGNPAYIQLMTRTMHSLLIRMNEECAQNGSKLAVVFLPCRAEASPVAGLENSFYDITYADEVRMVEQACQSEHIPTFNGEARLEQAPAANRPELFYLVHMNQQGHQFFANQLFPFIQQQVNAAH